MEINSHQSSDRNYNDLKILVTGASGFIGSKLLKQLIKINDENSDNQDAKYSIRCLTRKKNTFNNSDMDKKMKSSKVEVVEGDLSKYDDCLNALKDVDIAYYLVHSMEGASKDWKKFSEKEQKTAENFANAADKYNINVLYDNHQFHTSSYLNPQRGTGFPFSLFESSRPHQQFRCATGLVLVQ